jgi:hypothetical protein
LSPKILRRCDVCGRFHASYIVPDPERGGKAYYCNDCWKAKYTTQPPPASDQEGERPEDLPMTDKTTDAQL